VNQADGAHAAVSADVIERMRQDAYFRFLTDGESFEVGYRSPDPQVARTVAGRLTRLYVQVSLDDRAAADNVPRHALDAQIDAVRSRLLNSRRRYGRRSVGTRPRSKSGSSNTSS
jgi:hypothetical protein